MTLGRIDIWSRVVVDWLFLVTDCQPVAGHCRPALPLCDILRDIIVQGIGLAFIGGHALCMGMCAHWHNPVGLLSTDLGMIDEHVHLEHFAYVNSYVSVAWPDTWLMGALLSR